MPPKPKFGKAEIINAGLTIAKNEGLDQVTARSIAKTLGSSVCPVFSYFDNMEHLRNEIVVAAKAEYKKYTVEYSIGLLIKSYIKSFSTGEAKLDLPTIIYE